MSEWYEQLLERQLERNRDVWAELREHSVEDDSDLRLGFRYLAPGKDEAKALVAMLRDETDYDVRARTHPDDGGWIVIGRTQPTPVRTSCPAAAHPGRHHGPRSRSPRARPPARAAAP